MEEKIKLFDLETKEKFTKELKKSIFENRVDISYIVNILNRYDIDLVEVLSHYDEGTKFNFEKEIFSFEIDENGDEKLKIVLNNDFDKVNIETGNKHEILEILEDFVNACEEGYDEYKEGKEALSSFFGDID